jgi:hypothetical protein
MLQQAQNDFYASEEEAAMDYAEAVNAEIKDLFAAGADVVQIDEPYMQARPEKARQYGLQALNARSKGAGHRPASTSASAMRRDPHAAQRLLLPAGTGRLPLPPGVDRDRAVALDTACCVNSRQADLVGCLDLSDMNVETPEVVADRIRRALEHVRPEQVVLAPDCGMKYLPREVAQGKLAAMVEAAKQLRREHAAAEPALGDNRGMPSLIRFLPGSAPLVLDSPHSGVAYPADFRHDCELSVLRQAETPTSRSCTTLRRSWAWPGSRRFFRAATSTSTATPPRSTSR